MAAAKYFSGPPEWRRWLAAHHRTAREVVVGFYKRHTARPSLTWPESVDEALCFGWIDGIRRRVDAGRYTIRFTPRKPTSIWSRINIARVKALTRLGRMRAEGLAAFARRDARRSAIYSYEQTLVRLASGYRARFRRHARAWAFFTRQAPWYQRTASRWVMSAKTVETRLRRLATLIADSARGRRIAPLARNIRA